MRVVFATAELSPVATVGGLAAAAAGLGAELRTSGVDLELVMPDYGDIALVDETIREIPVPEWVGSASIRHGRHPEVGELHLVSVPGMARPHPYLQTSGEGWEDNPERFFRSMASGNSAVDQEIMSRPEIQKMLMENYREAMRAGVRGFAREGIILSGSWGFRLEDISIPVDVWHGEEDANVSLSAARHLADTIPDCHATFLPGEGHWLFLEHWEEILRSLLS